MRQSQHAPRGVMRHAHAVLPPFGDAALARGGEQAANTVGGGGERVAAADSARSSPLLMFRSPALARRPPLVVPSPRSLPVVAPGERLLQVL